MTTSGKTAGHTVRPRRSWKQHKLLYFVVFIATTLMLYRAGAAKIRRAMSEQRYSATATVSVQMPTPVADPAQVKQQITSAENLRRAVGSVGLPVAPQPGEPSDITDERAVEEIRRGLRVDASQADSAGELQIAIGYSCGHPRYCVFLVNALAEQYAADCRRQWETRTAGAYAEAKLAMARAQRDMIAANARLNALVERGPALRPPPGPTAEPAPVDNPRWAELRAELERTEQYREELLADQTPLHPRVRESDIRMSEIRRQLSATPRKIPGKIAAQLSTTATTSTVQMPSPPEEPLVPEPVEPAGGRAAAAEVARTREAYDRAVLWERHARQTCQWRPRIDVRRAAPLEVASQRGSRSALLFAALFCGVVATLSVGVVAAGIAMEPAIDTAEEVEALLGVPVVGTIPSTGPERNRSPAGRRQSVIRATLILGGLLLIAALVAVLFATMAG